MQEIPDSHLEISGELREKIDALGIEYKNRLQKMVMAELHRVLFQETPKEHSSIAVDELDILNVSLFATVSLVYLGPLKEKVLALYTEMGNKGLKMIADRFDTSSEIYRSSRDLIEANLKAAHRATFKQSKIEIVAEIKKVDSGVSEEINNIGRDLNIEIPEE